MTNYFAKNIKYLRNKKNIDQQVMAEDLGVAQSTLSCWENGIRTPDLDMVAKISKYLNVYDDFISKDLTDISQNSNNIYNNNFDILNQYKLLFDKDDKLSQEQKQFFMDFLTEKHKQIDENSNND